MLDPFFDILRHYPTLALFLTIGLGFLLGKLRIGSFSLGSVTAVLITGVIVGQLDIPMSGPIKMFFFMLFLFSVGYSVGPDFFRSLRGSGLRQAMFAVVMSSVCFAVTFITSRIMGYNPGEAIGLFAGSQTCSALLGVGTEAINRLSPAPADLRDQLNIAPVCYAVTYIFGTLGTVIILGNLGPRLLGGAARVKADTARLEERLATASRNPDPALVNATRGEAYRAYRITAPWFDTAPTVAALEAHLRHRGHNVYIDRLRRAASGDIICPAGDDTLAPGDDIVACGRNEDMVGIEALIGPETADTALLAYPLARVGVVVARKPFTTRTLSTLRRHRWMHGIVIRDAVRDGSPVELTGSTTFRRGDRLTIVGRRQLVRRAAPHIGHLDRPTVASDLMFVGLAIFIGGLFGALSVWIGSIPVSFGTAGGSLIAGLVFGWLRSRRPTFGQIPPGALWVMNNLGLNVFIAVIGIESAPSFAAGIAAAGPMLLVAGAVATTVPVLTGLWLGHKVFRFNPAITLGCCAGTRTCTAALGAVQQSLGSTVPAIGYTVTYAVSNILLVIWGLVTVLAL